jgi:glycosyltransferase involved in cell wall biosynthesis
MFRRALIEADHRPGGQPAVVRTEPDARPGLDARPDASDPWLRSPYRRPARPPARVVLLAPRPPFPTHTGDRSRVLHLARELARHVPVTLMHFGEESGAIEGVRTVAIGRSRVSTAVGNLSEPSPLLPLQTRMYRDARMSRAVAEELRRSPAGVVHAATARMAPYLPPPGRWRRHIDLIDALSLNMAGRAEATRGPAKLTFALEASLLRRYEARCVRLADTASLVSEADRLGAPGLERAVVIPQAVDAAAFPFGPAAGRAAELVFFGNLGYFHNVEPARRLAEEILPLVREELPLAGARLIGARPAARLRALGELPGVTLTGRVEDMGTELRRASVAMLPSFSGSGIKNKVLEAFSSGLPVVTNPLGIAGVEGAVAGRHYLAAATVPEMAAAAVRLMREPRLAEWMAQAARDLVEERYTWERQAERLLAVYGEAGDPVTSADRPAARWGRGQPHKLSLASR